MRRLAALFALIAAPAWAGEDEPLRLACRPDQPAMSAPLAFSVDLAAGQATETTSGRRFTVAAGQDVITLDSPNGGTWRIDRVTGRFARVDTQLRLEGVCDKVGRRF